MHALIRAGILVLGVLAVLGGAFAMASPEGFSDVVAFPPHTHFVHDLGAFQLGTVTIAVSALVAAAAFVGRWRELGWVLGEQPAALPPAVAVLAHHKAGRRPAAGRIMGSD
jgi:hypothetical protein